MYQQIDSTEILVFIKHSRSQMLWTILVGNQGALDQATNDSSQTAIPHGSDEAMGGEKQNDTSQWLEKKQNHPRTSSDYGLGTVAWKEGETCLPRHCYSPKTNSKIHELVMPGKTKTQGVSVFVSSFLLSPSHVASSNLSPKSTCVFTQPLG